MDKKKAEKFATKHVLLSPYSHKLKPLKSSAAQSLLKMFQKMPFEELCAKDGSFVFGLKNVVKLVRTSKEKY